MQIWSSDEELFEITVVVAGPASEGAIETVHPGVARLSGDTFARPPAFLQHQRTTVSAHVIQNALIVGAVSTQSPLQSCRAHMECIGDFFQAQSEQVD